jgi:hypothetical protein
LARKVELLLQVVRALDDINRRLTAENLELREAIKR